MMGAAFAVLAGLFSAMQYGVVTLAKQDAASAGAGSSEALDALGSWTATFGVASVAVNAVSLFALCGVRAATREPPLEAHTRVIFLPASAAGICYCASLLFTTVAVQRGGNAVTLAQRNAASLIVAGAWGVLWYKEVRGWAALGWIASAALTLASVILLGLEKGSA